LLRLKKKRDYFSAKHALNHFAELSAVTPYGARVGRAVVSKQPHAANTALGMEMDFGDHQTPPMDGPPE